MACHLKFFPLMIKSILFDNILLLIWYDNPCFFKLSSKSHCMRNFSKVSSFYCNPCWVRENIAKSSTKSKDFILAIDNFRVSLSSDCVFCFSNNTGRSFINKLKNNGLKVSPCLSPINVLNRVENGCCKTKKL